MRTIDEDIKNGTLKRIYLLYGEERYLRNLYRDKLKKAVGATDMNVSSYTGKDFDLREMIDLSDTVPFLSDRRLILLEETGLAGGKRSGKDKDDKQEKDTSSKGGIGAQLADYIPRIPESTVILMTESEVDKRSVIYKAVSANGYVSEFEKQDENTLTKWILGRVKKENKQITTGAMELLFAWCGTDMVRLESELNKLFAYTYEKDSIHTSDVEAICSKLVETHIFEMITDVATGKKKEALSRYYELLANKEPPMRILYLLARQFNQLLMIRTLSEEGNPRGMIARKLKLQEFIVKKCLDQSRRFEKETLRQVLEECVELEEAVKTGRLDESMSVELLLLKYADRTLDT